MVVGGAGFIGSHLTCALAEDNEVVVIDDLSTGKKENIQELIDTEKILFIEGSITDLSLLQKMFADADYVFHEAAIPSVPRSIKNPFLSNEVNVTGTLNVLVAARDTGVKKVVYASSSSIYGDTPTLPKKEDMKPCPLSPYAVSKLSGEYYCNVFTECYGLPTVALRYFNVYGPRQDPHSKYAAVIPKFITRIQNGESPIIYGDGEQTRDFTFVKDVINANALATENKFATGVFNIACGKRITINNLAKNIIDISVDVVENPSVTKWIKPVFEKPRPGDILHSLADVSKAKQQLHFEPKYSIKNGLEETIQWF
jgi:UDP-glucose 4-epimerase